MKRRSNRVIIGKNIRKYREEHSLSIDELAEMLNLSPAFIGLVERGKRGSKLENLIKLSEIFDIDLNNIIYSPDRSTLEIAENIEDDDEEQKRKTLMALMYDLDEKELTFIILAIKNLKKLRNNTTRNLKNSKKTPKD